MIHTYNEFKVKFVGKEIASKVPTERKSVRISEQTAGVRNYYTNSTFLLYEMVEEPEKEVVETKKMGRPPKEK